MTVPRAAGERAVRLHLQVHPRAQLFQIARTWLYFPSFAIVPSWLDLIQEQMG